MEKQALKDLGVADDLINKVIALGQQDVQTLEAQVSTLTAEKESLASQVDTNEQQLKQLKKDNADNETLQAQIKSLQDANSEAKANAETELGKVEKNYQIELALRDAHVRDSKAVLPYLDTDAIKYADGKLTGLSEQIEPLKAANDWLFESEKPEPTGTNVQGTNPAIKQGGDDLQSTLRDGLGLANTNNGGKQ